MSGTVGRNQHKYFLLSHILLWGEQPYKRRIQEHSPWRLLHSPFLFYPLLSHVLQNFSFHIFFIVSPFAIMFSPFSIHSFILGINLVPLQQSGVSALQEAERREKTVCQSPDLLWRTGGGRRKNRNFHQLICIPLYIQKS